MFERCGALFFHKFMFLAIQNMLIVISGESRTATLHLYNPLTDGSIGYSLENCSLGSGGWVLADKSQVGRSRGDA